MEGLQLYKNFIDGLVKRKDGVMKIWITEKGYPDTEENRKINELLNSLSENQRELLAGIVSDARIGGIHDTLAYIDEMIDCDGLTICQNGIEFPTAHFDSMHFDFICRSENDEWSE